MVLTLGESKMDEIQGGDIARRALGRPLCLSKIEQSSECTKSAAKVVLLSLNHNRAYLVFPFPTVV